MAAKQHVAEFARLSSNIEDADGEELNDGSPASSLVWPSGGSGRWCKVGIVAVTVFGLLALLSCTAVFKGQVSGGTVPGSALGSNQFTAAYAKVRGGTVPGNTTGSKQFKDDYAKAIELFKNRVGPQSPWALMDRTKTHVFNKEAHEELLHQHKVLPHLPPGDTNRSLLKLKLFEKNMKETVTRQYLRVSECMVDSAFIVLKIASAILSLEAALIVCPAAEEQEGFIEERTTYGRRLGSLPIGRTSIDLPEKQEKEMACVGSSSGVIANLAQVSQYLAASLFECPFEPPHDVVEKAECASFISLLTAGTFKSIDALSDIKSMCLDPDFTSYTRPIKPGRQALVKSACVIVIGQATNYLASAGLSLDELQHECSKPGVLPNDGEKVDPVAQAHCGAAVAKELASVLLVATYLAGAAAACGETIMIPSLCSMRVTGALAGLSYITEAGFGVRATCVHDGKHKHEVSGASP